MARWIHVALFAAIGAALALGMETPAVRAAGPKPAEGFTLHIDAKLHFPGKPDMIAHHYCKGVSGGLTECLLFESDEPDARLVGVEVIVGPAVYATFSADEKAMWHYHKEEIPKVSATLPDLSAEEAAKVVKSIEDTYGKIYLIWDPGKTSVPTGQPSVTVLH
jgi:hypothetical protein